ncbi:MAG: hypothetical protein HRT47_05515 [Candidatus Caenarcaniphilales bacterium]|nr:hypothetical protein [Candidatus Caenarcaniphilales bacterium]
MKEPVRVNNLSQSLSLENTKGTQDSIVSIKHTNNIWDENYQNLNLRYRDEMINFLKDYLKGSEYYLVNVKGELTNFIHVEDLVDLFIKLGDQYALDARFVLAVHVSETSLTNYTTLNNPGNVGNDDYGARKEFFSLEQGFEAMFISLADFADGKKWSFNGLEQDTLAKINYHLIKTNHLQSIYPAYYMSNARAPYTITRLIHSMGWTEFDTNTNFTLNT